MSLLRFLGIGGRTEGRQEEPASLVEICSQLDDLPADQARLVAAFSYLLARVAEVDLRPDEAECEAMARRLETFADIDAEHAKLLVKTAIHAASANQASDNHLVARAFRNMSDEAERIRLLRCLYAVAAADENISGPEDNEIFDVADAIGVRRLDVVAIRSEFKEYLGSLKPLPNEH